MDCVLGNSMGSMLNFLNRTIVIWLHRDFLDVRKCTVRFLGINWYDFSNLFSVVQKKWHMYREKVEM